MNHDSPGADVAARGRTHWFPACKTPGESDIRKDFILVQIPKKCDVKPYWQSRCRTATIYIGDSADLLDRVTGFDAVITDPPYGVGINYEDFDDSPENVINTIPKIIKTCIRYTKRTCITPGPKVLHQRAYPIPDNVIAWIFSAGVGCHNWGFSCWQPILCYGKDPFLEHGRGSRPDVIKINSTTFPDVDHPCPKPSEFMLAWVERCTAPEDVVLDPFTGSGSTGVACVAAGRKFIGFEMTQKYCDIAVGRIRNALVLCGREVDTPVTAVNVLKNRT